MNTIKEVEMKYQERGYEAKYEFSDRVVTLAAGLLAISVSMRGQRADREGRGSGSEWRIRAGAEVEEVTAMPTVDVVDLNNQKVSEVELADDVFGAPVTQSLLYEAVRQFQASNRAGTHATK